jgi:hypothetical protein
MKVNLFYCLIGCAILIASGCSPKLYTNSPEVNFLYKEAQGTIAVRSTGFGKNRIEAIADAERSAFKTIMLFGLPGTELNVPMIENGHQMMENKKKYFTEFFDEFKYRNFIMSSIESSKLMRVKGTKRVTVDIKINYNSLRKDLEQNQIIRKFGY